MQTGMIVTSHTEEDMMTETGIEMKGMTDEVVLQEDTRTMTEIEVMCRYTSILFSFCSILQNFILWC